MPKASAFYIGKSFNNFFCNIAKAANTNGCLRSIFLNVFFWKSQSSICPCFSNVLFLFPFLKSRCWITTNKTFGDSKLDRINNYGIIKLEVKKMGRDLILLPIVLEEDVTIVKSANPFLVPRDEYLFTRLGGAVIWDEKIKKFRKIYPKIAPQPLPAVQVKYIDKFFGGEVTIFPSGFISRQQLQVLISIKNFLKDVADILLVDLDSFAWRRIMYLLQARRKIKKWASKIKEEEVLALEWS